VIEFSFPVVEAVNLEANIVFADCQAELLPLDVRPKVDPDVVCVGEGVWLGFDAGDGEGVACVVCPEAIVQYIEYTLFSCP
jgi:hypothetical protein